MGGAAKAGGILALIGGALVLLEAILGMLGIPIFGSIFEATQYGLLQASTTYLIIALALGALALIGGILALAEKKAGGVIALIVAIIWIIPGLLLLFSPLILFQVPFLAFLQPPSFFFAMLGIGIWIFTIEGILVLVGGILGLTASGD